jgi:hypothetical protein
MIVVRMLMIVIIPIVIRAPAVRVFVPPAMIVLPAVAARFGEFLAPVLCLGAVWAVMLDGLMEFVIGIDSALLTVVIGADMRRAHEKNGPYEQCRGQYKTYFTHISALL